MKYVIAFLVVVVAWLALVMFQPQPREGWSDDDKSLIQFIYLPTHPDDMKGIAIAADSEFFCSKNTQELWKANAFLGIHLPAFHNGKAIPCSYRSLNAVQPWEYSSI